MGYISSAIKSGVTSQLNQIKGMDVGSKIESAVSSAGVDVKVPKVDMPQDIKFDGPKLSELKMPAGMTNYIPPLVTKALGDVKLPSEIAGVPIPSLPDLSSVTSDIEGALSKFGLDTTKLGIRDVSSILEEPNLFELSKVPNFSSFDPDNIPDVTKALDDFDFSEAQAGIDSVTGAIPSLDGFNISKYF